MQLSIVSILSDAKLDGGLEGGCGTSFALVRETSGSFRSLVHSLRQNFTELWRNSLLFRSLSRGFSGAFDLLACKVLSLAATAWIASGFLAQALSLLLWQSRRSLCGSSSTCVNVSAWVSEHVRLEAPSSLEINHVLCCCSTEQMVFISWTLFVGRIDGRFDRLDFLLHSLCHNFISAVTFWLRRITWFSFKQPIANFCTYRRSSSLENAWELFVPSFVWRSGNRKHATVVEDMIRSAWKVSQLFFGHSGSCPESVPDGCASSRRSFGPVCFSDWLPALCALLSYLSFKILLPLQQEGDFSKIFTRSWESVCCTNCKKCKERTWLFVSKRGCRDDWRGYRAQVFSVVLIKIVRQQWFGHRFVQQS